LLVLAVTSTAWAQDLSAVELQVERLRAQLREATDKEAQLRERARRLEDDLRPENVERSVASVGTTDARALRERRRLQLEREKAAVDEQLASLAASRARLEGAISTAEAEAVRLRAAALGASNAPPTAPAATTAAAPAPPAAAPAVRKRPPAPRKSRPRKARRPRRRS
jgi:cell division protein FtsB